MGNKKIRLFLIFCFIVPAILTTVSYGDYKIVWSTIDSGGGKSSGGNYVLTGTIGQADAGYSQGANFELLGGFRPGGPLCFVDLKQFAAFALHWLDADCDSGNGWCDGADLNHLNGVDYADLEMFVQQWLYSCPCRWPLR